MNKINHILPHDCDGTCKRKEMLLKKSNHTIGCELEGYADVLRYRNLNELARQLDEIASRLKWNATIKIIYLWMEK